jgi:hypothetical protein
LLELAVDYARSSVFHPRKPADSAPVRADLTLGGLARWIIGQVRRDVSLPLRWSEGVPGCDADPLNCLVDVHPPQPHSLIATAAGQGVPINAEHHRVDEAGVGGEGLA